MNTRQFEAQKTGQNRALVTSGRQTRYVRRRIVAIGVLVALVFTFGVIVGSAGAAAEIADPVETYDVVADGETLWDVAVRTAPDGMDPRQQLIHLRELNGFDQGQVSAWTVVAIPAQ